MRETGTATREIRHFWHPFTQMREYARLPRLNIVRGDGCWLVDESGNRYLDANASIWTNTLGHNHPELNRAIETQLHTIAHTTSLGLGNPTTQALAERLAQLAPGSLNRVFFSDNGSNAVEIAIKQSFQFWQLSGQQQRKRVIALGRAYHGDTFGTMALGDSGAFHERFSNWFFPVDRMPAPIHTEAAGRVFDSDGGKPGLAWLDAFLEAHADETACLIMEPTLQGAAGMRPVPATFCREVARRCSQHDIHLILDEVFVGFGRCGNMLESTAIGIEPDFLCLAKGLTAGYLPLAATVTTDRIFNAFLGEIDEWRAFYHGHTFTGNPLASAVAVRNIELIESLIEQGCLERSIAAFSHAIGERILSSDWFPVVRHRGLAACIELPGGFPVNDRVGMQVAIEARNFGVIVRPLGDSLLVVPPLVISEAEIEHCFDGILQATANVLRKQPIFLKQQTTH